MPWNHISFVNGYLWNCVMFFFSIDCPFLLAPMLGSPISPSLRHVQSCSNDTDTAESAITPLMFVSSELFPLPPAKERGQHLDATQIDCLPLMPVFIAACLSALLFYPYSNRPVYLTDWLSWHFLTVSFNHFTVTVYHYGARQAGAFVWYNGAQRWHIVQFT